LKSCSIYSAGFFLDPFDLVIALLVFAPNQMLNEIIPKRFLSEIITIVLPKHDPARPNKNKIGNLYRPLISASAQNLNVAEGFTFSSTPRE